jgi:hypothetical protein
LTTFLLVGMAGLVLEVLPQIANEVAAPIAAIERSR